MAIMESVMTLSLPICLELHLSTEMHTHTQTCTHQGLFFVVVMVHTFWHGLYHKHMCTLEHAAPLSVCCIFQRQQGKKDVNSFCITQESTGHLQPKRDALSLGSGCIFFSDLRLEMKPCFMGPLKDNVANEGLHIYMRTDTGKQAQCYT